MRFLLLKITTLLEEEKSELNPKKVVRIAKKYANMAELNNAILNELIDSIVVHNSGGKPRKSWTQKIEINYKFLIK
ncbi:MAG: hypothetical protein K0R18_2256 [Bacillales bacterium]|jgi:hypothetical protein|nr:hypothetical protein [Bacillales bacterium]